MVKISFELPATITVLMGENTGDKLVVETSRFAHHADTLMPAFILAAVKTMLNNAYNGPGAKASQAEKLAKAQKKLDAWHRGELNVIERGDSQMTSLREAYVDEIRELTGASVASVNAGIKDMVTSTYGEKESATFGRFMDAMGQTIARNEFGKDATAEQIANAWAAFEAEYQAKADENAKKLKASGAKVDLSSIALAQFKKAK